MRHLKSGRKFGRNPSHRRAMFRNMAGNLVLHERIRTTDAKAKELRRVVDKLITRAVRLGDDLTVDIGKINDEVERERVIAKRTAAQREVAKFLPKSLSRTLDEFTVEDVNLVHKLFHEIAPRYVDRAKDGKGGGYTRIIKAGFRYGDAAPMAIIEFVDRDADAKGTDSGPVQGDDEDDFEDAA